MNNKKRYDIIFKRDAVQYLSKAASELGIAPSTLS